VLFSGAGWFFDGYVINVWPLAIPFVMTGLHLTVQNIGTITRFYVIAYRLGTLAGGTFSDCFGRRRSLVFGIQ
jgi:MFS family permease